jgi:hypothetical protein
MATKDSLLLSVRNALHRHNSILRNDFQTEYRAVHTRTAFTQNAPPESFVCEQKQTKKNLNDIAWRY